ncbi:hypothetical protein COOONC_11363 [Cooperia oncophora]
MKVARLLSECGAVGRSLSYNSLPEVLQICHGRRKLTFRHQATVTQTQFTQLCSRALYLETCFQVVNSDFTIMNCPHLRAIKPCSQGQQVFTIIGNDMLERIIINSKVIYPRIEKIMVVQRNSQVPPANIAQLKKICPHCLIEGFFSKCRNVEKVQTLDEFMKLCAGERLISATHGLVLQFNFTESQINELFSGAVEIKLCLNIRASRIRRITFPKLTRWKACRPGKNALNFINNPFLERVNLPSCTMGRCIESGIVSGNPRFSPEQMQKLQKWCPSCKMEPYVPACGLGNRDYTAEDFVRACAGYEVIIPKPGTRVVIHSWTLTEKEINKFCSNAVYMEVCMSITQSSYRSLRCPRLKSLRSCQRGSS